MDEHLRVEVLVLSCNKPPYDALYAAQKRTWGEERYASSSGIVFPAFYFCDDMDSMPSRLRHALYYASADYVFRTNSSSYVDKKALLEKCRTMPREKCYAGINGGGFVSGSGMILSVDVVNILRRELPDKARGLVEDEVIGRVLDRAGVPITVGERYDYWLRDFERRLGMRTAAAEEQAIRVAYHLRCKSTDAADEARRKDVEAMEAIHFIKSLGGCARVSA